YTRFVTDVSQPVQVKNKNRNSREFLQQMICKNFLYKMWFEPMFFPGSLAVFLKFKNSGGRDFPRHRRWRNAFELS
ncbi:hypothetical protein COS38_02465, partial [Candidatus Berkelbacteria bacterium CG03_land_8_20_14_0_80_40_36]